MDIQKEREAFEQALVNQKNVSINNLHVCTIFDAEKNKYSPSDVCDPKEDFIVDWINSSWSIWQAAKAQAVPDLGELQERIAGHQYYHDERGHMIVDMDDVVKEISGFDSWKAQAVPKWVSVEDRLPPCDFEFCETGEHVSNAVLIHSAATYGFNMGMGHVNEDGVWNAYSCEHDFMNVLMVTHWMPLPDAPQEPAND